MLVHMRFFLRRVACADGAFEVDRVGLFDEHHLLAWHGAELGLVSAYALFLAKNAQFEYDVNPSTSSLLPQSPNPSCDPLMFAHQNLCTQIDAVTV